MKKIVSIFLALVLMLSLCACDTNNSKKRSKNSGSSGRTQSVDENSDVNAETSGIVNAEKFPEQSDEFPLSEDEYDSILASGEGYYLVSKFVETYNMSETQIGIVDQNRNWVLALSSKNIFGEAVKKDEGKPVLTGQKTYLTYEYLGDGIFIGTLGVDFMEPGDKYASDIGSFEYAGNSGCMCYFYNAKNNKSWQFDANYISAYEGDYMLVSNYGYVNGESKNYGSDDWYFIVDKEGNVTDLNLERTSYFSALSDGVFLNDGIFYNTDGRVVLDISEYDLIDPETICFIDGECEIIFINPAGSKYVATIDKKGNFIKEPTKCSENNTSSAQTVPN